MICAGYFFVNNKKGVSSCQLAEYIGITQKSADFLLERLRCISDTRSVSEILKGTVEMDETLVGGKNYNRHKNKKIPHSQGRSCKGKIAFWGAVGRESSSVIVEVVSDTKLSTLLPRIRENVEEGSSLYSDEWYKNSDLYKDFNHQMVNHRAKQYVNGETSTNYIESVWAIFKRTICGTYHHISKKRSSDYANEFTFRFNIRKFSQQERFDLLLLSSIGKRLTYQQLIS